MKLGLIMIGTIFFAGTVLADWEKSSENGKDVYVNRSAQSSISMIVMNSRNTFTVFFRDRALFNQFGAATLLRTRGEGAVEIIDTPRMGVVVTEGNGPIVPMLTRLREMEPNLHADILQMTAAAAATPGNATHQPAEQQAQAALTEALGRAPNPTVGGGGASF